MKEFVVYMGRQPELTISGNGLSRVYRIIKGTPVLVDNYNDKMKLLLYKEVVKTACCGSRSETRPFMEDVLFCKYQNIDLNTFREKWNEFYENK